MAESWCNAFGRYLRTLRQRRGLSLQEVCSLSQAFAERVDKSYLSRCENGFQGPAFSKIIPLSRIYEVPADVLLERLELDMELDRVGSPDTEGLAFSELTTMASEALDRGYCWKAYGLLRDALPRSAEDPVNETLRDREEQVACAHMNCATAARRLGRRHFALYEFNVLEAAGALGPRLQLTLLERLSHTYLNTAEVQRAIEYGDRAISEAERLGLPKALGLAYSNRALIAYHESDLERAGALFRKSYDAFRRVGWQGASAQALVNIAQVHFDRGYDRAARRSLRAAFRLAAHPEQPRVQALSRLLMGEIDEREHRELSATRHWEKAVAISKTLGDRVLRFKAEYYLLRQATHLGRDAAARSILRRLNKLAKWIPEDTPELTEFRTHLERSA